VIANIGRFFLKFTNRNPYLDIVNSKINRTLYVLQKGKGAGKNIEPFYASQKFNGAKC
jgi:hypothetical protein